MNKHYIRVDSNNFIIYGFSDAFEQPQNTDIYIHEGDRHFELNGQINPPLFNEGVPIFKRDGQNIINLTYTDIQVYKDSLPKAEPSLEEKNRADIDYIMIMQGL